MDQNSLVELITKEVLKKIESSKEGLGATAKEDAMKIAAAKINITTPRDMAKYIDHTLLKPESRAEEFDKLCKEAIEYQFKSVCVNSSWVSYVAKKLQGTKVLVCSVVGFPLGAMTSRSKAFETREAIEHGASEIDMVLAVGKLRAGDYKYVEEDILSVRRATRSSTILKVILETSMLTDEEKIIACQISKRAGADFVKTSTGFGGGGATVADVLLMKQTVGEKIEVKASGGIRDFATALAMLEASATRIGTGSGVAVVSGMKGSGGY